MSGNGSLYINYSALPSGIATRTATIRVSQINNLDDPVTVTLEQTATPASSGTGGGNNNNNNNNNKTGSSGGGGGAHSLPALALLAALLLLRGLRRHTAVGG